MMQLLRAISQIQSIPASLTKKQYRPTKRQVQWSSTDRVWQPFHNPYYGQLAKRLHDLFGYDKFVALTSGAEAADAAVKIARKWGYLQKQIPEGEAWVLTAGRCYHGVTLSTVAMRSEHQKSRRKFSKCFIPGIVNLTVDASMRTIHAKGRTNIALGPRNSLWRYRRRSGSVRVGR